MGLAQLNIQIQTVLGSKFANSEALDSLIVKEYYFADSTLEKNFIACFHIQGLSILFF
jgi:hypothetical protein